MVQASAIIFMEGAFVYGLSTVLSEYRAQVIQQLTLVNAWCSTVGIVLQDHSTTNTGERML